MPSAYRDCSEEIAKQLASVREGRIQELETMRKQGKSIYVRRAGRVWFGIAGISCAIFMALLLIPGEGLGPRMLIISWPLALIVGIYGAWQANRSLAASLDAHVFGQSAPTADLDRLRSVGPLEVERDMARSLGRRSTVLPAVAIVLLAPLSLHAVIAVISQTSFVVFEGYMRGSTVLVGISYIAVALKVGDRIHTPWRLLSWATIGAIPAVLLIVLVSSHSHGDFLILVVFSVGAIMTTVVVTGVLVVIILLRPLSTMLRREEAILSAITEASVYRSFRRRASSSCARSRSSPARS